MRRRRVRFVLVVALLIPSASRGQASPDTGRAARPADTSAAGARAGTDSARVPPSVVIETPPPRRPRQARGEGVLVTTFLILVLMAWVFRPALRTS